MNWFNHAEWKRGVVQIEFRRYFKYVSSLLPQPSAQPGHFPVSLVIEITPLATVCQLRCKGGHESTFNTLPHSSRPRNTWGRRNFFSISSPWLLLPHSWQWIVFSIHASMPVEWSLRFGGWLMVKEWTVLRGAEWWQPTNHPTIVRRVESFCGFLARRFHPLEPSVRTECLPSISQYL